MTAANLRRTFGALFALFLSISLTVAPSLRAEAADLTFIKGYPSISGSGIVGSTLTSFTGSWSPTPTSFTYQWYRGSSAIAGANGSTYELQGEDYLNYISLTVTGIRTGYTTASASTSAYAVYVSTKGTFKSAPAPSISGTLEVGETISANTSAWDSGVTFTYQWYANGSTIFGATSASYILQPSELNDQISVRVTGNKTGFNSVSMTSPSSTRVTPSLPKVSWNAPSGPLTGKNYISAKAIPAYKSSATMTIWCFELDGKRLSLANSDKGAVFTDPYGQRVPVRPNGTGCFTASSSNLTGAQIRVDVTNWTLGNHTMMAFTNDSAGYASRAATINVIVNKTAPTVLPKLDGTSTAIAGSMAISATTTTHSASAPVTYWCVDVDGVPISKFGADAFKGSGQASLTAGPSLSKTQLGCVVAPPGGNLSQGSLVLDSQLFTNGQHDLNIKVQSSDGESTWWSDPVKLSFTTKNKYIPQIKWSVNASKVTARTSQSYVDAKIAANIPDAPGSVVISTKDDTGSWIALTTIEKNSNVKFRPKFEKDTEVQIEIYDADKILVLTETKVFPVSPLVKLAKPRISLFGDTLSDKTTKTVNLAVTSSKGQSADCKATWGGSSKSFKIRSGKGAISFSPGGNGSVSVTCNAEGMTQSKPVSVRY